MSGWTGHLRPSSPRYDKWREILGTDEVPIVNPIPVMAILGIEETEVYHLDLARLNSDQNSRLIDFVVERFGAQRDRVLAELLAVGFPIRAADVTVAIDLRFIL